jgi:hypothetical protein
LKLLMPSVFPALGMPTKIARPETFMAAAK